LSGQIINPRKEVRQNFHTYELGVHLNNVILAGGEAGGGPWGLGVRLRDNILKQV